MTKDKISRTYRSEYTSWRNAVQRCRNDGFVLAPEFQKFKTFLEIMRPKPTPSHTLDRVKHDLKEYSRANCRWADKVEQSANRSNTLRVVFEGELIPLVEAAKRTGQKPDTLRRRKAKGWIDEQIIGGVGPKLKVTPRKKRNETTEIPEKKYRILRPVNDPWQWLSVEPHYYKFWRQLYRDQAIERRVGNDEDSRDEWVLESSEEFVLRASGELLQTTRGENSSGLNTFGIAPTIRSIPQFNLRSFREHLLAVENIAFQQITLKTFRRDWLVIFPSHLEARRAMASGPICTVPWIHEHEDIIYGEQSRLLRGFKKASLPLPRLLASYMENRGSVLLRTNKPSRVPIMPSDVMRNSQAVPLEQVPYMGTREPET